MRPELVIGFAAETNQIDKNAEEKLNKKNCDWIISNDVSNKDIGFNSCLLYTSPSPRDRTRSRMPSSA